MIKNSSFLFSKNFWAFTKSFLEIIRAMPIPQLKVDSISRSFSFEIFLNQAKRLFLGKLFKSSLTDNFFGTILGKFPIKPPPVMCAIPLTSINLIILFEHWSQTEIC